MATDKLVDFDHVTDYISREAAIDAVDVCNLHRGIIDALQAIISDIPAADVVEVVRCKDCAYYNTTGCAVGFGWCEEPTVSNGVDDNYYCAGGIRRADNG